MTIFTIRRAMTLIVFTCVLGLWGAASTFGQSAAGAVVARGTWETSVTPGTPVTNKPYAYNTSRDVQIGIRDKSGRLKYYSADFRVNGPGGGQLFKQQIQVTGNKWGYVTFPTSFTNGVRPSLRPALYDVSIFVEGQGTVVHFRMNYTPN